MFAALLALASASSQSCKVEHAHYALRTQPSVTADFRAKNTADWPGNLVLRMHIGETGRTYWWVPWNGGTNGKQNLASTTNPNARGWKPPDYKRPLGDVDFIATDASYRLWNHVPVRGETAPAHFLISDLREALWYRTAGNLRDGTARQFFDLVSCRRSH